MPLDVAGVRERVLKIGKIPTAVKDGGEAQVERRVAMGWLTGRCRFTLSIRNCVADS